MDENEGNRNMKKMGVIYFMKVWIMVIIENRRKEERARRL